MECSQAVRQRFLVPCTEGSNPSTPAKQEFFMSFDTVNLLTGTNFQVTWDIGPRCNYDCSYCPTHRHDNFSKHASFEDLSKNLDFLLNYIDLYVTHKHNKFVSINFTGGEPTTNPNWFKLIKLLRERHNNEFSDKWELNISLTTNGTMGKKQADQVIEYCDIVTISYHTEADEKLKQQFRDRVVQFNEAEKNKKIRGLSINVMFHAQFFDECRNMCNYLRSNDIAFVPRVIGEEPDSKPTFAHKYSDDQLQWLKDYWQSQEAALNDPTPLNIDIESQNSTSAVGKDKPEPAKLGMSIGRPCCGGREMCLSSTVQGNSRKSTFVDFRNFTGWNCSVNWFFLHLEQQTDRVFHHQTCKANFGPIPGPIGKISEGDQILKRLRHALETKQMPTIICPKQTCGCGLCSPKSAYREKYIEVLADHVDMEVFKNAPAPKIDTPKLIPGVNI